ncbi:MAG: transcriptional regulator [Collimonas pratensis]|uniref:transcriptional regulator n=1 Tax=Collimonas pratensis TaxID=279113 RepID=UPI003C721C43
MPTDTEKAAFTKRLEFALRRSPESVQGATELALRFNLRHEGNAISPQTAHKWLTGRAIPTNDKLATIAKWLSVDQHWLHYGPAPSKSTAEIRDAAAKGAKKVSPELINLAVKIQELPPHRRYLVEELVEQLQQEIG